MRVDFRWDFTSEMIEALMIAFITGSSFLGGGIVVLNGIITYYSIQIVCSKTDRSPRKQQKITAMFIISNAVADFIVGCVVLPFAICEQVIPLRQDFVTISIRVRQSWENLWSESGFSDQLRIFGSTFPNADVLI